MALFLPTSSSIHRSSNEDHSHENVDQHQNNLEEQLDWLTVDHDDLRQDILERFVRPKYHPAMTEIDKWEIETITRVRHMAHEARRKIIDALDQHVSDISNRLNILTKQLREARDGTKPFDENNIQKWATTLKQLKKAPTLLITEDSENLIYGLSIDYPKHPDISLLESTDNESTLYSSMSTVDSSPTCLNSTTNKKDHNTNPTIIKKHPTTKTKMVTFGISQIKCYPTTPDILDTIEE